MNRPAITPAMKVKCLLNRWFTPCSLCGKRIEPEQKIEWDHIHALVHGGPHEYTNLRPVHVECHKVKSAQDVAANAKVKRILADKPSRRPMRTKGKKMQSHANPWGKARRA